MRLALRFVSRLNLAAVVAIVTIGHVAFAQVSAPRATALERARTELEAARTARDARAHDVFGPHIEASLRALEEIAVLTLDASGEVIR